MLTFKKFIEKEYSDLNSYYLIYTDHYKYSVLKIAAFEINELENCIWVKGPSYTVLRHPNTAKYQINSNDSFHRCNNNFFLKDLDHYSILKSGTTKSFLKDIIFNDFFNN